MFLMYFPPQLIKREATQPFTRILVLFKAGLLTPLEWRHGRNCDHMIMVEGNNAASFSNTPFYLAPRPADLVRMLPILAPL